MQQEYPTSGRGWQPNGKCAGKDSPGPNRQPNPVMEQPLLTSKQEASKPASPYRAAVPKSPDGRTPVTGTMEKESKECIILDDFVDGQSAEQCAHRREQLEEGPWKETSEIPEDQSLSPKQRSQDNTQALRNTTDQTFLSPGRASEETWRRKSL